MLDALTGFLTDLFSWLIDSLVSVLRDGVVWVIDQVGGAIVSLMSAVSVPSSISGGLSQFFSQLDSPVLYFVGALGIPTALGFFGAAFGFRLARKVVTLFQW